MRLLRGIIAAGVVLLGGCAVSSHPDYQKVVYRQNVSAQQAEEIRQRFKNQGLANAGVAFDALGRIQLSGTYENEREVELAFSVARSVVGGDAVSAVRPAIIRQKDWEVSATAGFANFIADLAKKFQMTVHLEQSGADNFINVSNAGLDGLEQFAFNSREPTLRARQFYGEMADRISALSATARHQKRILIVGHTDDIGDSSYNATLSEQRARSIGKIFQAAGISAEQIFYQGAGERLPIADNRTEAGRSQNRRVEIVDLSSDEAFRGYLASRQPRVAFYRTKPPRPADIPLPTAKSKERERGPLAVKPDAPSLDIDFGGQRVAIPHYRPDIGPLKQKRGGSFISQVNADESIVNNCMLDGPRAARSIRILKDDREYSTSDYLPGVYNSSWTATVNGHLIAVNKVAVLADGGSPARKPELLIYRSYTGDVHVKHSYKGEPEVNAYQGEKALLYRVFLVDAPIRCMDIVIPNERPYQAPGSALFYGPGDSPLVKQFNLALVRGTN